MRPFAALSITAVALLSACQSPESDPTLALEPPPQVPTWARSFGDNYEQSSVRVAVGARGDIALTGTFSGTIDFGGGELSSVDPTLWGENDLFLASLAADGTHRWSGATGASDDQMGTGVAVDAEGNATFVGMFQREMDLGAGTMTAIRNDAWMARFGAGGRLTWARQASSSKGVNARVTTSGGVAIGTDGTVVSAGVISGTTSFGGPLLSGLSTTYVTKLDTAGYHIWSLALGGNEHQPHAVAIDTQGGVFLVGDHRGWISLGATDIYGYSTQGYAASLASDGSPRWLIGLAADSRSTVNAVVPTEDEGAIIGGCFSGHTTFGDHVLESPYDANGFVAKITGAGAIEWIAMLSSACVAAIASDDAGNVHVGGQYTGAPIFPAGPLPYSWGGAFLAEIAPSGEIASARTFGDDTESAITGVVSTGGDRVISGWFRHSITIDETALTNDGDTDIFVARTR